MSKSLVCLWFYKLFGSSKAKLYLGLKLNMGQVCSRRSATMRRTIVLEESPQEVLEESSQEVVEESFQERYSSASASLKKRIEEYQA